MSTRAAALASLLNRPLAWERASLEATYDALRITGPDVQPQAALVRRGGRTPSNRVGRHPPARR
jgi:hypothetical protein